MGEIAYLGLGSNLGDRLATLQQAVGLLASEPGLRVDACSRVWETDPVGGPDQPDFLNVVIRVDTDLAPLDLLAACNRVESALGRVREVHWGPRTVDIDVLLFDDRRIDEPTLTVPHPAHDPACVRAAAAAGPRSRSGAARWRTRRRDPAGRRRGERGQAVRPAPGDPMSPARDLPKECLRCDWSGSTSGSACPNCGATLFRPAQARVPRRSTSVSTGTAPPPDDAVPSTPIPGCARRTR